MTEDRPNVVAVLDDADRIYRSAINGHDTLAVVATFRFAAVIDRERLVLSLSGPPTQDVLEALGDKAEQIADQMRLVANALCPPRSQPSGLELEPLSPR